MDPVPRIPLIEDLTKRPVPAGSNLLVEFDPKSLWYAASVTIAAGWIRTGGRVLFATTAQPPETVRARLRALSLDVEELATNEKLSVFDYYTASLGQKSKERDSADSLKVADLSVWFARDLMRSPAAPDLLRIMDDLSVLGRFNEEKSWVEFVLARMIPDAFSRQTTAIRGLLKGIHSDWVYKRLESVVDGVVEFKLDEAGDEPRNLIRISTMRNVGFDGRWHALKIGENFEVTLEK